MSATPHDTTVLLEAVAGGDAAAANRLLPLVYEELRGLAERQLRHEPPSASVQPTALVHDAYLRLVDQSRVNWQGRTHFFAMAATMMRRILVDQARARHRDKRGGGWGRIDLDDAVALSDHARDLDLLALDEALTKLAALNPREAQVIEMRFFAGLSVVDTATALGVSARTVEGDWSMARAWLKRELGKGETG